MSIQFNKLQKLLKTTNFELFVLMSIFIVQKMVVLIAARSLQDCYSIKDQGINF